MNLTDDELCRYSRHIALKEIGIEGQKKLKTARVVCVGAGGLANALLMYLAASGVGTLGIIDADKVDKTNLQRQVLFDNRDIGIKKVVCLQKKLANLNPNINIQVQDTYLTHENAISLLSAYEIIIDCTDNFPARYVVNDACFQLKKPDVFAGIYQFKGQCSVFSPSGPCYRCIYPMAPIHAATCLEAGVLGVLPGIFGLIQATEVIKLILNTGNSLIGRLLSFDALSMKFCEFEIQRDPNCALCGLNSNLNSPVNSQSEISGEELRELLLSNQCFLLDVREPIEYSQANIGGYLIPLKELPYRFQELPTDKLIVVHCKAGNRSAKAIEFLQSKGLNQCKSLRGGILGMGPYLSLR